jgi:hypothetical protein
MNFLLNKIIDIKFLLLSVYIMNASLKAKCAEFVLLNGEVHWDINARTAFWTIMPDSTMPTNWLSPDDFYNGLIYTRYEILSVATNIPCGMQFGIFQWHPDRFQRLACGELCENVRKLSNGVGSVAINSSKPADWWKGTGGVDFSRIIDLQSMGPVIWCLDPFSPIGKPGEGGDDAGVAWSKRFNWFPISLKVTVVAVSYGSTFSGWDNYLGNSVKQPLPIYKIDFFNESTDKAVPSGDEYSYYPDMANAANGQGKKLGLIPGQNVFFRTKPSGGLTASDIEFLEVPHRPASPSFLIDTVNHRTLTIVTSDFEYSDYPDMTNAKSGDGTYVSILKGTTKYFRKKATSISFKSELQTLNEIIQVQGVGFSFYPNPNNDRTLNIKTNFNGPYSIDIISCEGKIISSILMDSITVQQVSLNSLPPGVYFLRLQADMQLITQKLIIE